MAYTLQLGSNGIDVKKMQYYINQILAAPNLTPMEEDGIYGQKTEFAVAVFQYVYHLNVDGIIGQATWDKIIQEFKNLPSPAMERNKSCLLYTSTSAGSSDRSSERWSRRSSCG